MIVTPRSGIARYFLTVQKHARTIGLFFPHLWVVNEAVESMLWTRGLESCSLEQ